jgi:NAD-dependent deacetylase sirtuin 2
MHISLNMLVLTVVEPNQKDEEKETKSDDNDAEEDESKSGGDNGAKETHFADDDSDEDDEDEDDQGAFELDLTGPNGRNILNMIRAAAASQGIPIELILQGAQFDLDDDDDDEEEVEYPFEQRPNSLEDLAKFIQSDNCKRIVILAGAGMSVASGIPDFRSADGLYATMDPDLITATEAQRQKMRVDPSSALDQPLFLENPLPCLELNRDFILGTRNQKWKATLAHRFVELLHTKLGNKLVRLYTQNIDGLEDQCTKLPRDKVIAVHGSMDRVECALCKSESDIDDFADKVKTQIKDLSRQDPEAPTDSTPIVCSVCGCSTMKPAIVLFRSSLPTAFFDNVPDDVQDVDLLIVIGTSLRVAPANSIVWRVPRSALRVLVNRDPQGEHLGMNFDESESKRDFFAAGDCESTFLELMDHLGWTNELGSLLNHHQLPDSSAELLKERLAQLGEATGTENGDNDT